MKHMTEITNKESISQFVLRVWAGSEGYAVLWIISLNGSKSE